MALKIRLRQQGRSNRQTYRVVVADAKTRRDGKYVEKLGWYVPYLTENNCSLDAERLNYWLLQGAQMSEQVTALTKAVAPEVLRQFQARKDQIKAQKVAKRKQKKAAK